MKICKETSKTRYHMTFFSYNSHNIMQNLVWIQVKKKMKYKIA